MLDSSVQPTTSYDGHACDAKQGPMTQEELLTLHERVCAEARSLMQRKNSDYGANADPFRNFRFAGVIGFPVRMGDKVARLMTFAERGTFMVQEEGVEDIAKDLINYSVLVLGWLEDAKRRRG